MKNAHIFDLYEQYGGIAGLARAVRARNGDARSRLIQWLREVPSSIGKWNKTKAFLRDFHAALEANNDFGPPLKNRWWRTNLVGAGCYQLVPSKTQ